MLDDTKSGDESPHSKTLRNAAFALLFLVLAGCSRDGRMAASGTVTLDGKPLENGGITFQPAPGSDGHSAGGQIANGRFQLAANHGLKPGKYLVIVQAFKLTGRMVKDPQRGKVPEMVAVKFNEAGTIEATVVTSTANRFDFQLTSKTDSPGDR